MNSKNRLQNRLRGWLPKEPKLSYSNNPLKPRWRKPQWIALSLITIIALSFTAYTGVQTFIRYSNPQADITANYFEKTLNCTAANPGDTVEVKVLVNWHGYIFPEFQRQVQIADSYPESNFELVSGNLTREYSGYGGGDQIQYLLKVTAGTGVIELPKPILCLDNTEISLSGQTPSIRLD